MITLGIDVGGTKVLGVGLDGSGSVVAERRAPTPTPAAGEAMLDILATVAAGLAATVAETAGEDPTALGVGMPGLVQDSRVLRLGPHLAGIVDLDVSAGPLAGLPGLPGLPVVADNDATCAMAAEHALGAARDASDALTVTIGTGIGGGVLCGGRLVRGAHGFAGEIGHMVVDPAGPLCPCGHRGCWEGYASGRGLGRLARDAALGGRAPGLVRRAGGDPEAVRGEHVTGAAAGGDRGALAVLGTFGWWLALGLANLVDVLDPEVVIVGGGLAQAGDLLLDPVRDSFAGLVEAAGHRPEVPILPAALGERAGAIGAA
ncbi:MAG: ROK family protein, partial [Acidimicrobiales bacterium]